jgi:preprotein translocase subunit SecA
LLEAFPIAKNIYEDKTIISLNVLLFRLQMVWNHYEVTDLKRAYETEGKQLYDFEKNITLSIVDEA